jgi:hypothetical protein
VRTAVGDCADAPLWPVPEQDLLSCLDEVFTAHQRLATVLAGLVREAQRRGIPVGRGATGTAAWLRDRLRISASSANRLTELSTLLSARPGLAAALTAGMLTVDQAQVIAATLDALPDTGSASDPAIADKVQAELLSHAPALAPAQLRLCGRRILTHLEPDDDPDLTRERARRRAVAGRRLALTTVEDGRVRLTGWLDAEAAAIVHAALDPLCRPVPGDDRTPGQRRADALTDVCALALRTTALPDNGGDRPQLVVTVPFDVLRGRLGAATLDGGEELSAAQARRLACDAHVIPAVLGGAGEPLELGRARRLYTGAGRRALTLRDGGCAFPACDRPARWCDAHHIKSWLDGGETNLDNGVLLCRHHHQLVHHGGWEVRLGSDRRPEFLPPARLDPLRRPRRNAYHPRT